MAIVIEGKVYKMPPAEFNAWRQGHRSALIVTGANRAFLQNLGRVDIASTEMPKQIRTYAIVRTVKTFFSYITEAEIHQLGFMNRALFQQWYAADQTTPTALDLIHLAILEHVR